MTVNKLTNPPTPQEQINKINEIIDNTVVDQTYSATSTNAQSGVALNDAKFLRNTAGNSTSLTVFGNPSNSGTGNAINIGYSSTALNSGDIAMGRGSNARGGVSIALGFDATVSNNCSNAIQLGTGTNSTANTFNVGFRNVNNYQLLDGTTGYIPNARINMDTTVTASSTNAVTSGAVSTALGNKQDTLVSGTNIKTINNTSLLGSGNITIGGGLPSQTDNAGKILTTDGTDASWGATTEIYPIVTVYSNGYSGYVIYSNKLCKQWGRVLLTASSLTTQVQLMQTYANAEYLILTHKIVASNTNNYALVTAYNAVTTSTFDVYCANNNAANNGFYWETLGYLP